MVVKKKKTYKKQKGGLLVLPKKLTRYFNSIRYLIDLFYNYIDLKLLSNSFELIKDLKINIETWIRSENIYLVNLAKKMENILEEKKNSKTLKEYNDLIMEILKCALLEVFFSLPSNKSKFTFPDILKKIFINILFIDYFELDIQPRNKTILNQMFEEKIMNLLNIFHITSLDDKKYLIGLLRTLFLEEYQRIYGIPVFYGNTLDSYHNNQKRELGYNQFICEKVGVSSKDKRNYIINPVGALAWTYIDKSNYTYTDKLYNLLRKILRFDYVEGINKRQYMFQGLPKLIHLTCTDPSSFCIRKNQSDNDKEEIIQPWTLKKCSITYGCSLKMTPVIRKENIASDEHILELLSILLKKELDNPVPVNISHFEQFNRRRNGSVLSPIQEFDRRPQINNNQINSSALRTTQTFMQDRDLNNEENPINVHEVVHPQIPKDQINLNKNIIEYNRRYYDNYFEKLQQESDKLINNTKNNKDDIPKIKKLLSIIDKILNIRYHHSMTEYNKIHIPPIIYELDRQLKSRLSYLEKNKINKINNFYNISTSNLLQNENYRITLHKLYNEARRLTTKKEIEPRDIPKIKKLLELINLIQKTRHRIINIKNKIINDFSNKFSYLKNIIRTKYSHDFSKTFYQNITKVGD